MYFEPGEVITRMLRKCATEFGTSDEMTLSEFYGAILPFRNENQYIFCTFNQNHSENSFFPRTIPMWNSLPSSVVSSKTIEEFKAQI